MVPTSSFALAARSLPLLNVHAAIVPANDAGGRVNWRLVLGGSICAQLGKHYIDVITAQFYIKYMECSRGLQSYSVIKKLRH